MPSAESEMLAVNQSRMQQEQYPMWAGDRVLEVSFGPYRERRAAWGYRRVTAH
jgi:hypothetical protein